jgi:aromatic-L-amino-acid decarboxylase
MDNNIARAGDLSFEEFRAAMHRTADLVADYREQGRRYPVVPKITPGDVRRQLPPAPPEPAESIDTILDDYKSLIEPNVTHWNHPGFMAYFGITGSGPGIIGETLAAALNVNAMLWRTGPAPTELEEHVCDWLRQMMNLPSEFRGHINDTASIASLLALAAARERQIDLNIRQQGLAGRADVPPLVVYCSEHAHSSIDKAMITLGLGLDNLRRLPADDAFRLDVAALERAIAEDRAAGRRPIAVVATVGTTSTTSVDPVDNIAPICARENLWLHVDAAYAGSAAICPEFRALMPGIERADSLVTNPHKWLFTPVDCSVLFVREPDALRRAFSVVPEYLKTSEQDATNLMDYGVQLGRRFRALKLWMVIRAFGVEGLRARIRRHCELAREFAAWVEAEPGFEVLAPVPFSTVCFRAIAEGRGDQELNGLNERLLESVNADGRVFVSHTVLRRQHCLRLTIGNLSTEREHVALAWELIQQGRRGLLAG